LRNQIIDTARILPDSGAAAGIGVLTGPVCESALSWRSATVPGAICVRHTLPRLFKRRGASPSGRNTFWLVGGLAPLLLWYLADGEWSCCPKQHDPV